MLDKEETRLRAHGTTSLLLYTSLRSCWPRVSLRHEALPEERLPAHADPKLGLDTHPAYWKRKRLHVLLYCTVLYCTTILLHTLFTLVLYLSMYTRTHPKHTRGTNPFSAISPCITFLVIVVVVVVVVGLVTNSLLYYTTCIQASDVMPIPFSRFTKSVGRLFDFVWSRLLPSRLTLLLYSRRYTRALGTLP